MLRAVLHVTAFRRLWVALSLSSLGDWLGLLATTALAKELAGSSLSSSAFAVSGVLIVRLLPAVLLGPVAGAMADRFDRRKQMVVCDVVRFGLFASIPIVHTLPYLLVSSFLIEAVSLFWIPAKEASVPNLLPRESLEAANQLSLITTYGSAPVAAAVFAALSLLNSLLATGVSVLRTNPVDLALYFDAATFLFSAATVWRLREIRAVHRPPAGADGTETATGLLRSITEGWAFVARTALVRGLVVGMLGAFAAGGTIIALAPLYVGLLGGGNAAYGVLFGAVFLGLAAGMALGPRLLGAFSRRRLFGLAIVGAGACLCLIAVQPDLVLAVLVVLLAGAFAGVGWVTGYTLLGLEVEDRVRGRTFAFVQSLVRVDLLLVLATAPMLAGVIGDRGLNLSSGVRLRFDGVSITLFLAGLLAAGVGLVSYRQMDDRRGIPLWQDLLAGLRGEQAYPRDRPTGFFLALEGGEGAGKSTQARLVAEWLAGHGREVVVTREPGATGIGRRIRALLLDPATGPLSPRTEALLYAADRAEHVAEVIRPALARGAVVVSDRYVDSSLAYQGAGRELSTEEVARLSRWATEDLTPDLTVLLDLPPAVGLARAADRDGGQADRIEAEARDFHDRVAEAFRRLARAEPDRYLVLPAGQPPEVLQEQVRRELAGRLGLTGPDAFAALAHAVSPVPESPARP